MNLRLPRVNRLATALLLLVSLPSVQLAMACDIKALGGGPATASRDRAPVAFVDEASSSVYLSWRLLDTDKKSTSFDIYRCHGKKRPVKVNSMPITEATNLRDMANCNSFRACQSYSWIITAVEDESIVDATAPVKVSNQTGQGFTSVSTGIGAFGRSLAFGDVNGDGVLDFTLRYSGVTVDPYHKLWRPSPGTYKLVAFDSHGKQLWRYDMGPSIERGIWYSPYLVYDLDQNGAAEIIVKGSDDALSRKDLVDSSGRVTKGPEYLKIISGKDGNTQLASAPWPDRSGFAGGSEPYSEYNRYSRNQMAIAYVDGEHPHVVVVRGTYGKQKVHVYRYAATTGLRLVWRWENKDPAPSKAKGDIARYRALDKWWGQGAHTIRVGDLDQDGKDEIIIGGIALDDDGTPLWSINKGDLDHIYLGDLSPTAPGLEVYYGAERGQSKGGMGMVGARTGGFLWQNSQPTKHIHKEGLCADLYKTWPGVECYSGEADHSSYWTWSSGGKLLSQDNLGGLAPKAVYWGPGAQKGLIRLRSDVNALPFADIVDVETGAVIAQIQRPATMIKTDRSYFKLLAIADVIGDWREEILAVDRGNLVIYMSTVPTNVRQPWLMSDHTYKMNAILSSMGYYHQPLLGYDLQTEIYGSTVPATVNKGGVRASKTKIGKAVENELRGILQ